MTLNKQSRSHKYFEIFIAFFKLGPITFGGGYAMIPLFEHEVVMKKKWVKESDVSELFALAGTIPGAVAVNSATLIGYRIAGFGGALAAMIGIMLPTVAIVLLLGYLYLTFQDQPLVANAFEGIRAAVIAMIVFAAIRIGKSSVIDKSTWTIGILTVVVMLFFSRQVHPLIMVAAGVASGIAIVAVKLKLGLSVKLPEQEQTYYTTPDYFYGDGI